VHQQQYIDDMDHHAIIISDGCRCLHHEDRVCEYYEGIREALTMHPRCTIHGFCMCPERPLPNSPLPEDEKDIWNMRPTSGIVSMWEVVNKEREDLFSIQFHHMQCMASATGGGYNKFKPCVLPVLIRILRWTGLCYAVTDSDSLATSVALAIAPYLRTSMNSENGDRGHGSCSIVCRDVQLEVRSSSKEGRVFLQVPMPYTSTKLTMPEQEKITANQEKNQGEKQPIRVKAAASDEQTSGMKVDLGDMYAHQLATVQGVLTFAPLKHGAQYTDVSNHVEPHHVPHFQVLKSCGWFCIQARLLYWKNR
jgi:hypothetical protein